MPATDSVTEMKKTAFIIFQKQLLFDMSTDLLSPVTNNLERHIWAIFPGKLMLSSLLYYSSAPRIFKFAPQTQPYTGSTLSCFSLYTQNGQDIDIKY